MSSWGFGRFLGRSGQILLYKGPKNFTNVLPKPVRAGKNSLQYKPTESF